MRDKFVLWYALKLVCRGTLIRIFASAFNNHAVVFGGAEVECHRAARTSAGDGACVMIAEKVACDVFWRGICPVDTWH